MLSLATHDAIAEHAMSDPDHEVVGIVGRVDGAERVVRLTNASPNPGWSFNVDPAEFLAKCADMEIIAIYHSHTDQAPYPSPMDVHYWSNSALIMVIYSVVAQESAEYMVRDGHIEEV